MEGTEVDVVVPCYNDGPLLLEALASVPVADTVHVVVVNDGSTEASTLEVLAGLKAQGVRVMDQANKGLAAARNTGMHAGRSPYVLFLDADNTLLPGGVEAMRATLDHDADAAVAYGDREEFGDRTGLVKQRQGSLAELLVGNRLDACAMIRRSAIDAVGGFDEAMRDGYEDWELWIRMFAAGQRFVHVGTPTFRYRVRPGSLLARADDPRIRTAIIGHVVRRHADLFLAHVNEVISALHGIQAYDKQRLRELLARMKQVEEEGLGRSTRLTAEVEELNTRLASGQALAAALKAELASAEQDKDNLVAEAQRLNREVAQAMGALDLQREHARALQAMLAQSEERIRAMEASKLWRLRKQYHRMRALLRTSSDTPRRGLRWVKRITFLISSQGRGIMRRFLAKVFKALYLWTEVRPVRIVVGDEQRADIFHVPGDPYHQFMARHFARGTDLREQRQDALEFAYRPLVSVVMPVYAPPLLFLEEAVRSVQRQSYAHWELCIADDRSPDPGVRKLLERLAKEDPRIKLVYRAENGHISRASNSALEVAAGEFVALMDHDDLLAPDALFQVVKRLQSQRTIDILYTDEDKVDEQGRHSEPHFKPQWCPDHLLSRNYIGHLVVVRRALMEAVGGFRTGFEGSQDFDLLLRLTERTDRIVRIPRVLYHWRIHAGSAARSEEVKPYAYEAARRALTEALERRGEPAEVSFLDGFRGYGIRFTAPLKGRVSIIIPTKDKADVLRTCLTSIFTLTDHPDFDVLVVSNNSREQALFDLLAEMKAAHPERFDWVVHDIPFNFSALMNEGLRRTRGEHVLFLNNDTEVLQADWLRAMHEWSQRPSVGAVGVKLLYHNDTIQHAGVVIGLGGVAGHVFVHEHRKGPGYFNYVNTVNNYSAVTAACMMVERTKLERIQGWDEDFTVEYNDVDLCLRLREGGYNNVYVPHVELYHYESLSRGHPHLTKESYERHLREVALFKERWSKYIADDPCYDPNLSRGHHDWRFEL